MVGTHHHKIHTHTLKEPCLWVIWTCGSHYPWVPTDDLDSCLALPMLHIVEGKALLAYIMVTVNTVPN
jgi:hypothetical protein